MVQYLNLCKISIRFTKYTKLQNQCVQDTKFYIHSYIDSYRFLEIS